MFEKIAEFFKKLMEKRLLIRKAAFVLLAIIMIVIYFHNLNKRLSSQKPPVPAYVALKCDKCGHTEDRRMFSLKDAGLVCSVCGGPLGYRMKCRDCEFEFPFFPHAHDTIGTIQDQAKKDAFITLLDQISCPNCGGAKTFHISPTLRNSEEDISAPSEEPEVKPAPAATEAPRRAQGRRPNRDRD